MSGGRLAGAIFGAVVMGLTSAAADSAIKSGQKANNPRPKKTLNIKCKCGANMSLNRAKFVYSNSNSCNCDSCRKHISSYNWLYHCNDHRNNVHPNGYDLCLKCSNGMFKHQQKAKQIEDSKYIQNELISMGFNKNDIQQILPTLDTSDKRKAVHIAVKLLCNKQNNNANVPANPDNYVDMVPSAPVLEQEGTTMETKLDYEQEGAPNNVGNNYGADNNGYNYSNDSANLCEQKFDDNIAEPSVPVLEEVNVNNNISNTEMKVDKKLTNTGFVQQGKVNELIYKKGWMKKAGSINTMYQARFFKLQTDKKLKYYKADPDVHDECYCGTVDFKKCKILKMYKLKNLFNQFHVVTKKRVWKFSCDSEQIRNEWYDAIKSICTASNQNVPLK